MPLLPSRPRRADGFPSIFKFSLAPAFLVVTLLAFLLALAAPLAVAAGGPGVATPPTPAPTSSVEGIITSVKGSVVELLGGAGNLSIDLSQAKIVPAEAAADGAAVPPITPGAQIWATVEVPLIPTAGPALLPLKATYAVIRLANSAFLHGQIQGVSVSDGLFTMLERVIHVGPATEFGGDAKSLADLKPGMSADVTLTVSLANVSAPVLLALRVVAHGPVPPVIFSFRGIVKSIGTDSWTIGDQIVGVTTETKIVGDPKEGDLVDVIAQIVGPPNPMMGMPSRLVAISITKESTPPPPVPGRTFSFTGPVRAIPPDPFNGVWKIGGKDVVANGLTRINGVIVVGDIVDVKGHVEIGVPATAATVMMPFSMKYVAESITKKK
jgi:hypothetical protein